MYICIHIFVYKYVYTYVYIYIYIYMYFIYMRVYIYIYIYMCVCVSGKYSRPGQIPAVLSRTGGMWHRPTCQRRQNRVYVLSSPH